MNILQKRCQIKLPRRLTIYYNYKDMSHYCPVCTSDTVITLGKVKQEEILLCIYCGLAFIDSKKYTYRHEDWYGWLDFSEEYANKYLKHEKGYYLRQLKILSSLVSDRHILDIGAGMGVFARVATENGWSVTCTDINSKAVEFGNRVYNLTYKELEDVAFNSKDAIRISHVLEHIPEPGTFLLRIKNILKNGGVCVIMVPHYEPLSCVIKNIILNLVPGEHDFRGQIYPPVHILGFTPLSLKKMLESVGLIPLKIVCVSRGNRVYYPWNWGLTVPSVKEAASELVNTLGNIFGRGSWIIGYFRK